MKDGNQKNKRARAQMDKTAKNKETFYKKKKQKKQPEGNEPSKAAEAEKEFNVDLMLNYLEKWKKDRINWKFNKNMQVRLMRNWKKPAEFPKNYFKLFLEYAAPIKGHARLNLFKDAKQCIREQKSKVNTDAISYVLEFMEPQEKKKYENMDIETRNKEILKTTAARKYLENELMDNTVYKRAKALYNVLVLTDEEQGGNILENESGEESEEQEEKEEK